MKKLFLSLLLITVLVTGCSSAAIATPTKALTKVKLPMGYIPNIQFAPFYVAMDKGYFKDQNIDLEFDYAFETDGIALVAAGEAPFSLASGEQILLARSKGLPITYVYSWYKEYPVTIVTTDPTVKSVSDLKGKTIGIPGLYGATYVGLRALLASADITEKDVKLDSIGYSQVESIVSGNQQTVVGYTTNEPILLTAQGFTITSFNVSDSVELASNGIVTNEKMITDHPEIIRAFITAFNQGLKDTIADPAGAYEISKKYVDGLDKADQKIQMEILTRSIKSWNSDMMGASDINSWQNMQTVLMSMGLYDQEVDLSKAFTNQFIK